MSNKFFKLTAIQLKGVLMTNQFNGGTKKQKTGKLIFVTAMFALMALLFILYCSLFTYAYITIGLTANLVHAPDYGCFQCFYYHDNHF